VFILKVVKAVCFDTLLQVLILKVVMVVFFSAFSQVLILNNLPDFQGLKREYPSQKPFGAAKIFSARGVEIPGCANFPRTRPTTGEKQRPSAPLRLTSKLRARNPPDAQSYSYLLSIVAKELRVVKRNSR